MKFTKLLFMAAVATSIVAHSGIASADTLDNIRAAKKIRVAIDLGAPFYGFNDDKMQPTGSDVDASRLLAKDLGVELEIVQTTNPTRIPNLQSNKADLIISSLSITPDRAKVVDFSIPYGAIEAAVGAPKNMNIKGMADLAGKTVAVTRGGPQDKLVTDGAPTANIIRFDDEATSITAAASGQTDIVAITPPIIHAINQKNPARQFEVKFVIQAYKLAIAMRKNEPRLMEWVNAWIKTNLKNGKLNEIHMKYAGVPIPNDIINGAN